jgi:hypothetical protein
MLSGLRLAASDVQYSAALSAGVQLLLAGRPGPALEALGLASRAMYGWPRLWLRLGECCIALFSVRSSLRSVCVWC